MEDLQNEVYATEEQLDKIRADAIKDIEATHKDSYLDATLMGHKEIKTERLARWKNFKQLLPFIKKRSGVILSPSTLDDEIMYLLRGVAAMGLAKGTCAILGSYVGLQDYFEATYIEKLNQELWNKNNRFGRITFMEDLPNEDTMSKEELDNLREKAVAHIIMGWTNIYLKAIDEGDKELVRKLNYVRPHYEWLLPLIKKRSGIVASSPSNFYDEVEYLIDTIESDLLAETKAEAEAKAKRKWEKVQKWEKMAKMARRSQKVDDIRLIEDFLERLKI